MDTQKSIDALNILVQINNDRIEGYEHASNETNEADLKELFSNLASTSRNCNDELIEEVESLDGEPTEGTKATGKFYRVWMDVKAALTNKDRKAILGLCEYGEDWAVKTYEDVLKSHAMDLTFEQNQLIRDQYVLIKRDHDTVRKMRDAMYHLTW